MEDGKPYWCNVDEMTTMFIEEKMNARHPTQKSSGQGERFTVRFELDGRRIAYTLTAGSVVNPFRRELLERFRCVDKL